MKDDKIELMWRQYELNVNLFKFYFDIVVKFNIFYYAITGAILSYYFTHADDPLIKYSLLLPVVMSFAFSYLYLWGIPLLENVRYEISYIASALRLKTAPETRVLNRVLLVFGILFGCTGLALLALFIVKIFDS
jgi:hypothetical protein